MVPSHRSIHSNSFPTNALGRYIEKEIGCPLVGNAGNVFWRQEFQRQILLCVPEVLVRFGNTWTDLATEIHTYTRKSRLVLVLALWFFYFNIWIEMDWTA